MSDLDHVHLLVFGNMKGSVFYKTNEWRKLRYVALTTQGNKCKACGRSPAHDGVVLHVDHIKPRSLFPELCLDLHNLQVLCEDCNIAKSNLYDDDFRSKVVTRDHAKLSEFFGVQQYHLVLTQRHPRNSHEAQILGLHTKCTRKKVRKRWRHLVEFCFAEKMLYQDAVKVVCSDIDKYKCLRRPLYARYFVNKQPEDILFDIDGLAFPENLTLLVSK